MKMLPSPCPDQTVSGEQAPGQASYEVYLTSWTLIGKGQMRGEGGESWPRIPFKIK